MSEAPEKPLPQDFPAIDTPENRINIRKALAGIYLLQGEGSQFRCLTKAGYSRSTARRITAGGLSAKLCIEEAAKLDARANPAKMLETARARAMLSIEACDPTTVPLKDAMKMLDTVEKYYGGHQLKPSDNGLAIAERLAGIAALLAIARERGLPVDARSVATRAASELQPQSVNTLNAEFKRDSTSASDNMQYVNSPCQEETSR